jgi:hypothetical protein
MTEPRASSTGRTRLRQRFRIAEERLAFALRFAYDDLAQLRPSRLKALRRDLQAFFWPSHLERESVNSIASSVADARKSTLTQLKRLQRRVRKFMEERFADSFAELVARDVSATRLLGGLRIDLLPADVFGRSECLSRRTEVFFDGPVEDCFLVLLSLALAELDTAYVRRCLACGRLFQRSRRRKFCSKPCVRRLRRPYTAGKK